MIFSGKSSKIIDGSIYDRKEIKFYEKQPIRLIFSHIRKLSGCILILLLCLTLCGTLTEPVNVNAASRSVSITSCKLKGKNRIRVTAATTNTRKIHGSRCYLFALAPGSSRLSSAARPIASARKSKKMTFSCRSRSVTKSAASAIGVSSWKKLIPTYKSKLYNKISCKIGKLELVDSYRKTSSVSTNWQAYGASTRLGRHGNNFTIYRDISRNKNPDSCTAGKRCFLEGGCKI